MPTTDAAAMRDSAEVVAPGVRRITAPNAGPGTFRGTNTYLVDDFDGLVAIDPGPDLAAHLQQILGAAQRPLVRIVLTHGHPDHCTLAPQLASAAGARIYGFVPSLAPFPIDCAVGDGEAVGSLTAIHTPGHSPDHLCLAYRGGVLFTGDLVMGWSSTVISPPHGRMADYFRSLERLLQRNDMMYLPGHGEPIPGPAERTRHLLHRRLRREEEIVARLAEPTTIEELLDTYYAHVSPALRGAAQRTVHAHLLKLEEEGRARSVDGGATWLGD